MHYMVCPVALKNKSEELCWHSNKKDVGPLELYQRATLTRKEFFSKIHLSLVAEVPKSLEVPITDTQHVREWRHRWRGKCWTIVVKSYLSTHEVKAVVITL